LVVKKQLRSPNVGKIDGDPLDAVPLHPWRNSEMLLSFYPTEDVAGYAAPGKPTSFSDVAHFCRKRQFSQVVGTNLHVCPGLYRRNVAHNHVGSHPKALPLQRCFKPLHAVLSILFARQVKTDDCASLETLVADSADVAVICLLPSDSCLRSAGHHSVPQCILEPNITDINGNHEHFRNRPAVRPRACRRGAWTANKFHLRRYSLR